jgi:Na+/H+ antiporter NhaD/arsenite permease-like protein
LLPVIEQLALDNPNLRIPVLAWALAFGACFGGNGTLIGASANIVTATLAEKRGHAMGFMTWLKAGVPVCLGSVVVVNIYMLLRYCT